MMERAFFLFGRIGMAVAGLAIGISLLNYVHCWGFPAAAIWCALQAEACSRRRERDAMKTWIATGLLCILVFIGMLGYFSGREIPGLMF